MTQMQMIEKKITGLPLEYLAAKSRVCGQSPKATIGVN